jgi:hypothetical protein
MDAETGFSWVGLFEGIGANGANYITIIAGYFAIREALPRLKEMADSSKQAAASAKRTADAAEV